MYEPIVKGQFSHPLRTLLVTGNFAKPRFGTLTWNPVCASSHQPVIQNVQRMMNVYACSFLLAQVVG